MDLFELQQEKNLRKDAPLAERLKPEKLEDLIAVNALYRPGPLGSGMVDDYIERKHGRKQTTYMFLLGDGFAAGYSFGFQVTQLLFLKIIPQCMEYFRVQLTRGAFPRGSVIVTHIFHVPIIAKFTFWTRQ